MTGLKAKTLMGAMIVLLCMHCSFGQATTQPAKVPMTGGTILSAVPADAWVGTVFNDLNKSGRMIDSYAVRLGMQAPGVQKKIGRMIGVSGQVEMSKPMALVVMRKDLYGDEPVAMIVSVKEYEKLAADLKGQTTETPGVMKGSSEELGDVYFGKKGVFVVLGPTEAIVKAVVESKEGIDASMDASSRKLLEKSDIFAHVNIQSIGQFVQPMLMGFGAMMQMGAMGGMDGMSGDDDPADQKNKAQMQAMQAAGAMINALVGFINETDSLDVGVKLDLDLIQTGFSLNFKSGQEMAGLLASQKQTDKPLIKGVAGDGFAFAAGWQWEPKITKLQEAFLQINPGFTDPADAEKYKKLSRELALMNLGQSIKLAIKSAKPGEPMFELQQVTTTKDAKKFIDLTRQMFEMQSKMGVAQSKENVKFQYETGVMKAGDVSVDRVTVDLNSVMNMPGMSDPNMAQVKAMLATLLGSTDGLVRVMIAPANEKLVVTMFGGDEKSMGTLIKSAKEGTTPLAKNAKVVQTAKMLPKNRLMEMYFDFGKLASGAMAMMMAGDDDEAEGDEPAASTFPAIETPLVGAVGSVEGSSLKLDMVVPFEVISNLSHFRYMLPTMPDMGADDSTDLDADDTDGLDDADDEYIEEDDADMSDEE
ncbi:MAG: hypothetical protein GX629_00660 [Phycisphaerae bacterium]|nr:hypothetical protein [Phycisphaerae bacterium]